MTDPIRGGQQPFRGQQIGDTGVAQGDRFSGHLGSPRTFGRELVLEQLDRDLSKLVPHLLDALTRKVTGRFRSDDVPLRVSGIFATVSRAYPWNTVLPVRVLRYIASDYIDVLGIECAHTAQDIRGHDYVARRGIPVVLQSIAVRRRAETIPS